jgi:hypothetical protein
MLKQSLVAATTALAIGLGTAAVTTTPAAADSYGLYLNENGVGVYAGSDRHRHYPPPPRYKRYSDSGCWVWSKRLHQRIWVCGPPHKYPHGPNYGGGPRHHNYD